MVIIFVQFVEGLKSIKRVDYVCSSGMVMTLHHYLNRL